jgi:hypothetical protein
MALGSLPRVLAGQRGRRMGLLTAEKQAKAIRRWRPWEHSTGPRTAEGKARSSMNAWKGGERQILRAFARLLGRVVQR